MKLFGHIFEYYVVSSFRSNIRYYKCKNCETIIYHEYGYSDKYYVSDFSKWKRKSIGIELNITCDEVIIMSILK